MLFRRFRDKRFKMVWQLQKNRRRSFLAGTAHFFPHSFKKSLAELLRGARTALFEGPLDESSMQQVVKAGLHDDTEECLLHGLDEQTILRITNVLAPTGSDRASLTALQFMATAPESFACSLVKGMKPWMAYFTLYYRFLEKNGWKYSVDMEAYGLARDMSKNVVFLETIEEQIEVLESLSPEQIIDFLRRIHHWKSYTRDFVKWYLEADLAKFSGNPYRFPTRNPWIIERRDAILYQRMLEYLREGDAVAFVGVPHVAGILRMLSAEGYEIGRMDA
ncbi:MAG: TraB/GumN family protein [Desulfomonile tiedjei]|nr:TraB/GumN family protein [Desulfomonile tiedjei]